jgi:phosphatidylinositol alpha-mannosyltransferase
VLGLARYLAAAGHRPYVLAPGEPAGEGPETGAVSFTSAGAAVAVPYNGSVARVNFGPLSAGRVRRWLNTHQLDLLHLHEPITPSIAVLALWSAEVPVVATFHTATPRSRTMRLVGGAMRATVERIDAGIAVSESARSVVVQHLGRDAVVVPNGFAWSDYAPGFERPAASPGAPWRGGDRPRLTFLGRVDEPRKGLDVLLAAVPALLAGYPDLDVVVAGQGTRTLPGSCRSVGTVSDQDKAELLAGSDLFVAPHLDRESFGIVLLEAMASGAGVVASALPAFRDLLSPPGGGDPLGAVVPVGDSAALASAALAALSVPNAGQRGRAYEASRRYDWSAVGAEVVEVYRATLAAAQPPVLARRTSR